MMVNEDHLIGQKCSASSHVRAGGELWRRLAARAGLAYSKRCSLRTDEN